MNDDNYSPWLDAGKPATIYGIPVLAFLVFLLLFIWPAKTTFFICCSLIILYKVLAIFGYTLTVLLQRIHHWLRGNKITGRPWWYRKFFE
ncbi:conjugal transfer protein [Photorhabdus heterorhabditis]|uniref:Conjugal transfer protein n=1 Tax=Photorhabdus heterorhabditis TaxID=880156 RepID=A0ABR5KAX3_9GAMM|nr:IcmT/TraK family protein [Photorhabdus heterorhabditis]KOY61565.1 conjugal transfer protein [Photorhabdus heterorhabditis]